MTARSETLHHRTTRAEPGTGTELPWGWMGRGIHGEIAQIDIYIYIKTRFLFYIYIYILKEFPERGRQGCSRAVQADRPQLPILTGLVPFSHGNCHGVKCPGCTPIPNSHPDAGVHIWKEHPPPQKPWDRGWCQPGTRLSSSWSGVGCPSICPAIHTRPQGGAFPKKMCFSVISPPHSLAMGRWVLSNELLGASHSCSYKYIDLGFFFPFSLKHNASIFFIYIYIYYFSFFFWLLSPPCG